MSKFTDVQDFESYRSLNFGLYSSLEEFGDIIDLFTYLCFNKYYEVRPEIFKFCLPDIHKRFDNC